MVIVIYLAPYIFIVLILCTLRLMLLICQKAILLQYQAFRKYIFQELSFHIRQYYDHDLNKDTLPGFLSERRGEVFANVYRHEHLEHLLPN